MTGFRRVTEIHYSIANLQDLVIEPDTLKQVLLKRVFNSAHFRTKDIFNKVLIIYTTCNMFSSNELIVIDVAF